MAASVVGTRGKLTMRWVKKGLIFVPPSGSSWMVTHAALPVVDPLDEAFLVYFSSRDADGRAQIGSFEFRAEQPNQIREVRDTPAVSLGPRGAFDDSGVTSSCLVNYAGRKYLYYSGWSRGVTVPFYLAVGLAISDDRGRSFQKIGGAPILDCSDTDPYLTASPFVLVEGNLWRMWYVSGTDWEANGGRLQPCYHIKYAESRDGVHWNRTGIVCIDFQTASERAFARPCVVYEDGLYRMWYCYRGSSYRIGYAESADGLVWHRRDQDAGITVSEDGWDSEMVAYPFVFRHRGERYMLYNGNRYGRTGIGLAVEAEAR